MKTTKNAVLIIERPRWTDKFKPTLSNVKPVCSDLSEGDNWFAPMDRPSEIVMTGGRIICRMGEAPCHRQRAERELIASAPALLAACEFGVKLCVAMARDADPHINLKRGESADFDAACDALDIFRAALQAAKGGKPC